MNRHKLLVAGLCAAGIVSLGSAGASAEERIAPKTLEFLEATTISGYVEASYVYNVRHNINAQNNENWDDADVNNNGNDRARNGNAGGANSLRAFDNNVGFTLNAIKLVFEKPLGEGDWAAGYRADLLFGQDARQLNQVEGTGNPNFANGDVTAEGTGVGTYIEQGYVAFRVPVGNGIDMKFGKFVALSGYEVIESPANLNFSRGLLFTWATPLSHIGLLGSYRFNDQFDAQLGIVNGWNNWVDEDAEPAVIARMGWRNPSGTASVAFSAYYGRARTADPGFAEGAVQPVASARLFFDGVANWKPQEKVLVGAEALWGSQDEPNGVGSAHDQWWGVAGYVKVQLTDKVSVAGRAEYLNDNHGFLFADDHASFDPIHDTDDPNVGSTNPPRVQVFSLTGTVNFDVWRNMLLRAEVRWDQASSGADGAAANGDIRVRPFRPGNDQLTFAVDAVYSF
jgi:hypothetical protein